LRLAFETALRQALRHRIQIPLRRHHVVLQNGDLITFVGQVQHPLFLRLEGRTDFILAAQVDLRRGAEGRGDFGRLGLDPRAQIGHFGGRILVVRMVLADIGRDILQFRFGLRQIRLETGDVRSGELAVDPVIAGAASDEVIDHGSDRVLAAKALVQRTSHGRTSSGLSPSGRGETPVSATGATISLILRSTTFR
jgi:hypothetical protein